MGNLTANPILLGLIASADLLERIGNDYLSLAKTLKQLQTILNGKPKVPPKAETVHPEDSEPTDPGVPVKDIPPPPEEPIKEALPSREDCINFVLEVVKKQHRITEERFGELKNQALKGQSKKGSEYTPADAQRLYLLVKEELGA